jgi:hypothetical protein
METVMNFKPRSMRESSGSAQSNELFCLEDSARKVPDKMAEQSGFTLEIPCSVGENCNATLASA